MVVGLFDGTLQLYTNTLGNFVFTASNYQAIDVGNNNVPFLFDINQDGLTDMICGDAFGKLSYFENTGTLTAPVFTLINSYWGAVNVTDSLMQFYGNSYPFIQMNNGALELLVGSRRGYIYKYGNITGNLGGTFTLVDSTYGDISEPAGVTVDGFDINGDAIIDLLTGNFAGGVTIYKQLPVSVNEINNEKIAFTIYPNPSQKNITVQTADMVTGYFINSVDGSKVKSRKIKSANNFEINVSGLAKGTYVITVVTAKEQLSMEFVKN